MHIDTAYATILIVPHGTFIHMEGNTMPRGVYDRSKAKPRKTKKSSKNLTFSPEIAEKFWALRDKAGESYPFELTNSQFFALLLESYQKQHGG